MCGLQFVWEDTRGLMRFRPPTQLLTMELEQKPPVEFMLSMCTAHGPPSTLLYGG